MISAMQHESFYTTGSYAVPELGIFAGWVAMEGSFADCQPVLNEQQDVALIFSGECFSDSALRVQLKQAGHQFNGNNAGWIVHHYEEKSQQFFADLNGLFSGLLIDKRQRRAFLFNDRYGMERLYYYEGKEGFFFASEAKALLRILPELRAFDEEGVRQYLTFGCTLEWKTLFHKVNLLPGGSLWTFHGAACKKSSYFVPTTWESQSPLAVESFETQFQETFRRILPQYFESDAEIGISLTGGLDTRMIMACLPQGAGRLPCYTFGNEEGDTLDARIAARVAAACGLPHHMLRIDHDFFSNFPAIADRTVYITDGCLGICGAHEIHLNSQAYGLAPVRLTGNFGSEVLRDMSTFKPLALSTGLFAPDLRHQLADAKAALSTMKEHPVSFAAFREIPWNLFGNFAACRSQMIFRTPYLDNALVALAFQAPEECRMSSAAALRLVRESQPKLASISTDRGQMGEMSVLGRILKRIVYGINFKLDYLYNEGMPHGIGYFDALLSQMHSSLLIFGLHKYLHYRIWFRREFASYVKDRLSDVRVLQNSFWNAPFLQLMAQRHASGQKNYVHEINAVLTVETIDRLLFRQSAW
jgi:asparagine synthase (glutamine-hydrolysing)